MSEFELDLGPLEIFRGPDAAGSIPRRRTFSYSVGFPGSNFHFKRRWHKSSKQLILCWTTCTGNELFRWCSLSVHHVFLMVLTTADTMLSNSVVPYIL